MSTSAFRSNRKAMMAVLSKKLQLTQTQQCYICNIAARCKSNVMQACFHNKNTQRAKCVPGLTAEIISMPSVVWCEIHCSAPSLISASYSRMDLISAVQNKHRAVHHSWSSQHYIKTRITKETPLPSSTSCSVHDLCCSSNRVFQV